MFVLAFAFVLAMASIAVPQYAAACWMMFIVILWIDVKSWAAQTIAIIYNAWEKVETRRR